MVFHIVLDSIARNGVFRWLFESRVARGLAINIGGSGFPGAISISLLRGLVVGMFSIKRETEGGGGKHNMSEANNNFNF
jgi:hypothetical protein